MGQLGSGVASLDRVHEPHDVAGVRVAYINLSARADEVDQFSEGGVEHIELEVRRDGEHLVDVECGVVGWNRVAHVPCEFDEGGAQFVFVGHGRNESGVPRLEEIAPPYDVCLLLLAHLLEQTTY